MSIQDLKKVLKDQLTLELELIELIEECLKEIFPNERDQAINLFRCNLASMEDFGCLQSLCCIRNNIIVNGKYIYRKEEPAKGGSV
jgi:hypothetical protein